MEPAAYIAIGALLGYLLGRDVERHYHRHVYDVAYQQALNDVNQKEAELVEQLREQASRN